MQDNTYTLPNGFKIHNYAKITTDDFRLIHPETTTVLLIVPRKCKNNDFQRESCINGTQGYCSYCGIVGNCPHQTARK